MPKPGSAPTQWASDTNFTSGPKNGQPTKAGLVANAPQGLVPGDTVKSEPINASLNECTAWAQWVYEGTSLNTTSAHIVETTAAGTVEVRGLVLAPDTDDFAAVIMDGTNLSTSWALEATDITLGFSITAASSANATLMFLDTAIGGVASFALDIEAPAGRAIRVTAVGNATASAIASIERDSGSGATLSVENAGSSGPVLIVSNDNDGAAAIDIQGQPSDDRGDIHMLDTRTADPIVATEGDLWWIDDDIYPLRFHADSSTFPTSDMRRVLHSPQAPVWDVDGMSLTVVSSTSTTTPGTTALTNTSQTYTDDRGVTIIFWFSCSIGTAAAQITVELYDVTATTVVASVTVAPTVTSTTGEDMTIQRVLKTTPPADGSRQYRLQFYRSSGSGTVYLAHGGIEVRQGVLGA